MKHSLLDLARIFQRNTAWNGRFTTRVHSFVTTTFAQWTP
jgi:hypothetical protein